MEADDLGSLVLGVLTGAIANYTGAELMSLRHTLQQRFQGQQAYADFASNPDGAMAQQRLIAAINQRAGRDAVFAEEISNLVNRNSGIAHVRTEHNERAATRFGDVSGTGHVIATDRGKIRIGNNTYPIGGVIGAGIIAVTLVALAAYFVSSLSTGGGSEPTLTKDSTCGQFMAEAPEVRDEAVRRIATELNQRLDSFSRLNVESTCGNVSSQKLGDAIENVLPPSE
ncbi:hypothetical protein ACGFIR_30750 [Micromonospora sp. NPDC049051]|uniref:hypothetical protein n=1 Tax=Micromonospora sp. NPDC049051 TaxID=3364264 RepID=UPI0037226564